jgi:uncharacterized membrane protein
MPNRRVANHQGQLTRIADDMTRNDRESWIFGHMSMIKYVLLAGEVSALGFGIMHLYHGLTLLALSAFGLEILLLMIHRYASGYEQQLHANHEERVRELRDELWAKEEDMYGTIEAFNLRVSRWYLRARRSH